MTDSNMTETETDNPYLIPDSTGLSPRISGARFVDYFCWSWAALPLVLLYVTWGCAYLVLGECPKPGIDDPAKVESLFFQHLYSSFDFVCKIHVPVLLVAFLIQVFSKRVNWQAKLTYAGLTMCILFCAVALLIFDPGSAIRWIIYQ